MKNKRGGLITFSVIMIVLLTVGFFWFMNNQNQARVLELNKDNKAHIANPATIKCIEQNYRVEIRIDNETKEQTNICIDKKGNECEEWSYFYEACTLE